MIKRSMILAFFVLLIAGASHAQTCLTAVCNASDCQQANVKAAFPANANTNVAVTVNIPACASTAWTTQLSYSSATWPSALQNLTVQGQTTCSVNGAGIATSCTDNTIIANNVTNNAAFSITVPYKAGTVGPALRITGISFAGGVGLNNFNGAIVLFTSGTLGNPSIRIDHCHFTDGSSEVMGMTTNQVVGVIDHVVAETTANNHEFWRPLAPNWLGDGSNCGVGCGDRSWASPSALGQASSALYLESSTVSGGGQNGLATNDCFSGGRYVTRFNIFINSATQGHTTGHAGDDRGCMTQEVYGNTYPAFNSGQTGPVFNTTNLESGTGMVWGNTVATGGCVAGGCYQNYATIDDKRHNTATYTQSAPPNGWGYCGSAQTGVLSAWDQNLDSTGTACIDQIGRGQGDQLKGLFPSKCNSALNPGCNVFTGQWPRQALEPMYIWNISWACGSCGGNYIALNGPSISANRDYYAEPVNQGAQTTPTSPFNGTSGVGHGTLANRPTTCTTGVGYWATDQGSWNQSGGSNINSYSGQGVLYQCNPANTWTAYYTPLTYPHPLINSPIPIATFTPSSMNMGLAPVGMTSNPSATVTLQNTGSASLVVTNINMANTKFSLVNNTCGTPSTIDVGHPGTGFTLTVGSTCTFQVIFQPGFSGSQSGSALFIDNTAGGTDTFSLTGNGTDPAAPAVTIFALRETRATPGHKAKVLAHLPVGNVEASSSAALAKLFGGQMDTLIQLYHQYPFLFGGVTIAGAKYVADVFISSLEAPTAQSSASYRYWFRVLNKFAANWERANNTAIERSPNWQDAVQKHNSENLPQA